METTVIMKRDLLGCQVSQNSKNEFLSATDLVKAGNKWRVANDMPMFSISDWMANKSTKEFVGELESKFGKVKINSRGKNSHTWVHPLLFIDMALSISPTLKIEVYGWLFDQLIKSRNESGDSYKKMCGYLFARCSNKSTFYQTVQDVANKIKLACKVTDWQQATESQLKLRDKIHNDIALLADVLNNNDQAIRIAIHKALN